MNSILIDNSSFAYLDEFYEINDKERLLVISNNMAIELRRVLESLVLYEDIYTDGVSLDAFPKALKVVNSLDHVKQLEFDKSKYSCSVDLCQRLKDILGQTSAEFGLNRSDLYGDIFHFYDEPIRNEFYSFKDNSVRFLNLSASSNTVGRTLHYFSLGNEYDIPYLPNYNKSKIFRLICNCPFLFKELNEYGALDNNNEDIPDNVYKSFIIQAKKPLTEVRISSLPSLYDKVDNSPLFTLIIENAINKKLNLMESTSMIRASKNARMAREYFGRIKQAYLESRHSTVDKLIAEYKNVFLEWGKGNVFKPVKSRFKFSFSASFGPLKFKTNDKELGLMRKNNLILFYEMIDKVK